MQTLQSSPAGPALRVSPIEPLRKQSPQLSTSARVDPKKQKKLWMKPISASAPKGSSAPKREKDPKKRVVITGMGVASVFGNNVDVFYDRLLSGESGIDIIDRFDASKFPTRFGGQIRGFSSEGYIDGKNDRRLDDYLRFCIVAGKKALEHASLTRDGLSKQEPSISALKVSTRQPPAQIKFIGCG
ncbi:3-oxoacyl-[acyl-carrier-protein] synthase I, chloroplastic-like isoform X2 [Macadamia integrifolia]|uniref:3-oxoacyl-[acyl-carrier-protein] synthase I, chloroplastic-like isoform X2 n=1 Tax=Macadamia integrifolia TaxID=60698 RepID=UPI001C4FD58E|nr:3-oxoacyl-[acyl-carrier-protein] synthase I, chloroplastic-like isoform X2 [Macadamia integrifolia]